MTALMYLSKHFLFAVVLLSGFGLAVLFTARINQDSLAWIVGYLKLEGSNYTDVDTGIDYISDAAFIETTGDTIGLLPIVFPVSLTGLSIAGVVPTSTIILNPSPVVLNPSPVILKPRRALPDPSGCIYSLSHRDPTRPDPRRFFLQHRPTSPIGPSDTDVRRPTVVLPDPTTCVVSAHLCSLTRPDPAVSPSIATQVASSSPLSHRCFFTIVSLSRCYVFASAVNLAVRL
ncbi:hypothetical protein LWI29_010845 [Acer saccharum]|uniref:Uncharacterized protein n=1 Tax=Acer saccharum TaxID=4024 RepID=A0AA39SSK0_ACESA|nr:hypothetical protein LWI29_010845 [Acer saccharum]